MDALDFLESLKKSRHYKNQLIHIQHIPSRTGSFSVIDPPLPDITSNALNQLGINELYSHQAEAIKAARDNKHIIVTTSTASGKSLCYNLPVFEAIENNPKARALYLFPTKALAQDQLRKLNEFGLPFLKAATYDGDTIKKERPFIKAGASIVLTNPDMLHIGILPYHTTWSEFFRNLEYVVVDEMHTYRGVFGAHVAGVFRRLRRIAEYYSSTPQFLCTSATVGDPLETLKGLAGVDAEVISQDGSPSGEKIFTFWNPPDLAEKSQKRSAGAESVDIFVKLVEKDIRTIVFAKARKSTELILRHARQILQDKKSSLADKIMAYRAGYTKEERREIERRLFNGQLIGVTATTALELGVDIGGLDAVVMAGYPGSIAATWQQAGRAGRENKQSLAILVAQDNPMDQFIMRNPNYFFSSSHERAIVDAQNPYILAGHLVCAAYELPIENEEIERVFGEKSWEILAQLCDNGHMDYRKRWYWRGEEYPAGKINIRSASGDSYDIVSIDSMGVVLGTVDAAGAFDTVHNGAIYLHSGESYIVTRLDINRKTAYVERTNVNYYTMPGECTSVKVHEKIASKLQNGMDVCFGDVHVTNRVIHYWRKQHFTDQVLEKVPLDLPEMTLSTEAVWLAIPEELTNKLIGRGFDLGGTIHAIEHVMIGIMPLFVLCDRNDIGGVSQPQNMDTEGLAAIFIYDGYEGGVGLSYAAYESIDKLLESALLTMMSCKCEDGCPSCIQSPKCGNNNNPLDKEGAMFLLKEILQKE